MRLKQALIKIAFTSFLQMSFGGFVLYLGRNGDYTVPRLFMFKLLLKKENH
jgi:hypothetical protein